MSTVESLPPTSAPVRPAELAEAAIVAEAESEVRSAMPATLPVAATVTAAAPLRAPAVAGGKELLAPLREAAGQLVPQLQYQIQRLGIVGQAGLVACVAAVALAVAALLPAQRALQSLQTQLAVSLHPTTMGTRPEDAVPRLVASLPTRGQIPAVIGQIFAQAQTAGVAIDKGRYTYVPPKSGSIGRYEVEFPVAAAYPAIRTFINGTLSAVPAASLGKLRFERKAVGEGVVNADVGFTIFVRGEGQP